MAGQPGLTMERTLDRIPQFDERSRKFGIDEVAPEPRYKSRAWRTPPPLDQGEEGACVGHGWAHEARTTPVAVDIGRMAIRPVSDLQSLAFWIYYRARENDEWHGEDYDSTSVLAGAKVMKRLGLLKEYRWGFSVDQVRRGVLTSGPAVLGLNWYTGMYSAPNGILTVKGSLAGGHCILATGYEPAGEVFEKEGAFQVLNSWGPLWGKNGLAWIPESNLDRLMHEQGEACIPYKRSYGRAA